MSLVYTREEGRLRVYDLLHDVRIRDYNDGCFLYRFDTEYNNNIVDLYSEDYRDTWTETMVAEKRRSSVELSHLLSADEAASIHDFAGENATILASGVIQLVRAKNGSWGRQEAGVACYIKDYESKSYTITVLIPRSGRAAKVIFSTCCSSRFETTKEHGHLVTFTTEQEPFEVCGLNFYDSKEAEAFHSEILEWRRVRMERRLSRGSQLSSGGKRVAPPPPSLKTVREGLAIIGATSEGVEIPVEKVEKKKKKKKKTEHKEGMIQGFFNTVRGKKKKEKKTLDISSPSDFKHLEHVGMENLTEDQKETMAELYTHLDVQNDNPEQLEIMKKFIMERHTEVRKSIRERKAFRNLSDARSSIMLPRKQSGNTLRDVKNTDALKKSKPQQEDMSPTSPTHSSEKSLDYDPLNPDWGEMARKSTPATSMNSSRIPDSSAYGQPVETEQNYVEEEAPPLPSRTVSRRPFLRQNTPPYDSYPSVSAPKLPTRGSSTKPPAIASTKPRNFSPPPPNNLEAAVVITPPTATPAQAPFVSPPAAPPLPPPNIFANSPSSPVASKTTEEKMLRPANLPSVSTDRRSFLDEIQSVDKTKILRRVDESPTHKPQTSPGGHGNLLESIQIQLDQRRHLIEGSSDDDTDDSSTDSDWSD